MASVAKGTHSCTTVFVTALSWPVRFGQAHSPPFAVARVDSCERSAPRITDTARLDDVLSVATNEHICIGRNRRGFVATT